MKYLKTLWGGKASINKMLVSNIIIVVIVAVVAIFICLLQEKEQTQRDDMFFPKPQSCGTKIQSQTFWSRIQVLNYHTSLHPLCDSDLCRIPCASHCGQWAHVDNIVPILISWVWQNQAFWYDLAQHASLSLPVWHLLCVLPSYSPYMSAHIFCATPVCCSLWFWWSCPPVSVVTLTMTFTTWPCPKFPPLWRSIHHSLKAIKYSLCSYSYHQHIIAKMVCVSTVFISLHVSH